MAHNITLFEQERDGSCGPAALRIVLAHFGEVRSGRDIRRLTKWSEEGVCAENIVSAAKSLGFESFYRDRVSWLGLAREVQKYPVIVNWFSNNEGHYSVAIEIYRNKVVLADPEYAVTREMRKDDFLSVWFDYKGEYPKNPSDFILRRMIVVRRPRKKGDLEGII
jgi:predicted double-glycine peptidase